MMCERSNFFANTITIYVFSEILKKYKNYNIIILMINK